jgi:hypothetical protein
MHYNYNSQNQLFQKYSSNYTYHNLNLKTFIIFNTFNLSKPVLITIRKYNFLIIYYLLYTYLFFFNIINYSTK